MGISRRDIRGTMSNSGNAPRARASSKLFDEIGTVDQVGIEERVAKFRREASRRGRSSGD